MGSKTFQVFVFTSFSIGIVLEIFACGQFIRFNLRDFSGEFFGSTFILCNENICRSFYLMAFLGDQRDFDSWGFYDSFWFNEFLRIAFAFRENLN